MVLTSGSGGKTLRFLDLTKEEQIKFDKVNSARQIAYAVQRVKYNLGKKRNQYQKHYINQRLGKLLEENHYRELDGQWLSSEELLKLKLVEAENAHDEVQNLVADNIKESVPEAFNHDEFIKKHGYLKVEDQWLSEKQAIDKLLEERKAAHDETSKKVLKEMKDLFFRSKGYVLTDNGWELAKDSPPKKEQETLSEEDADLEIDLDID